MDNRMRFTSASAKVGYSATSQTYIADVCWNLLSSSCFTCQASRLLEVQVTRPNNCCIWRCMSSPIMTLPSCAAECSNPAYCNTLEQTRARSESDEQEICAFHKHFQFRKRATNAGFRLKWFWVYRRPWKLISIQSGTNLPQYSVASLCCNA
jgi:hypothetical protein